MQPIKQFQNQEGRIYASVVCEPRQRLLMDVWSGELKTQTEVAEVVDHCLSSIEQHGIEAWLCDVSKLEGLFEEGAQAAADYLKSRLKNANLKKFAFISRKPSNTSRSLLVNTLSNHDVEVKTFACNATAMQWLLVPSLDDAIWEEAPVLSF